MESEYSTVQGKPYHCYKEGNLGRLIFRLSRYLWWMIIFGKYLLASHTLHAGWEKTADHLNKVPKPNDSRKNSVFTNGFYITRKVKHYCGYKEAGSHKELSVMHY